MASDAIAGVGAKFRKWNGSSWKNIAEINSITGPSMSRDTIDVTSLDSTGGYREFIGGFRDGGTVEMPMNFTRAGYDALKSDFESNDLQDYEIMLPDDENTSFEFAALVTDLSLSISPDDKITADVSLKVSGEVTVDSGSGS